RDLEAVHQFADKHSLEIVGIIPFDEAMRGAELAGIAPLDHDPDAISVAAIGRLAEEFFGPVPV
ncbi:MAG: hypothetical protein ACR2NB_09385, partial [Solirubrobacteraceae bacterium]